MVPAFGPTDVAPSPFNPTQAALEQFADFVIWGAGGEDAVAIQDPAGISIYLEYRMLAGIEQDGVGCLGAHAVQRKQFLTQLVRGLGKQAAKRAAIALVEKCHEGFQAARLLAEVASGTDHGFHSRQRCSPDALHIQPPSGAQTA